MTSKSNVEGLLDKVVELTTQRRFDEAKPIAREAMINAVREHGVIVGRISNLTVRCRMAFMRCGASGDDADGIIFRYKKES